MREPPWELPRTWPRANCSSTVTCLPRRARHPAAAAPVMPAPITIASRRSMLTGYGDGRAETATRPAPPEACDPRRADVRLRDRQQHRQRTRTDADRERTGPAAGPQPAPALAAADLPRGQRARVLRGTARPRRGTPGHLLPARALVRRPLRALARGPRP